CCVPVTLPTLLSLLSLHDALPIFGESSIYSGASWIRLSVSVNRSQSSPETLPERISDSFTSDSADSKRMTISDALISKEKTTDALLWCSEQDRIKSNANVDLPTPGRAAIIIICPECKPLVRLSRSIK